MWTLLCEIDSTRSDRYGRKACQLLAPLQEGLPLPDSWVLSTEQLAALRENPALALQAARELLTLAPEVPRFLLRSSSPHEDRPNQSAAGLFKSVPCAAREGSLVEGLNEMAASMSDPDLSRLLGLEPGTVPLAILAQENLSFGIWVTVECDGGRAESSRLRAEGFARRPGFRLQFELLAPSKGRDSHWREELVTADERMSEAVEPIESVLALARKAVESQSGPWLLELGATSKGPVLLQRRPVQSLAPAGSPPPRARTSIREDPPFADTPLFASDEEKHWEHDVTHSPDPLCPLLAGIFVRWIREKGEGHPTRLIHGRWYDRANGERAEPSVDATEAVRWLKDALHDWTSRRIPRLRRGLATLSAECSPLPSPSKWPRFVEAWLAWQSEYFDGAASGLRRAASTILFDLRRRGLSPPPLPSTVALQRERAMDELAVRLKELDEEERERALEHFLVRHGHVAPGPTDGRGVPWREDPDPLLAELSHRTTAEAATQGSGEASPSTRSKEEPAAQLAVRALAELEDDDDLLARAYALFRACALDLQAWIQPEAETAAILDLLPDDLDRFVTDGPDCDPERFATAYARGAALVTRWDTEFERENPRDSDRVAVGSTLRGQALAEGEAEGAPCILSSAQAGGGPPRGAILVVPLVLPSDAIVFSRCAAVICESGMVLGHAAVLAREKGIPAVVLPGACRRLARVRRARVDGGRGRVDILSVRDE